MYLGLILRRQRGILMGIEENSKLVQWNYLLAFDSDAEKLSRYIEFTENNYTTYSIELVRLLLSAASEVDVVAKLLCTREEPLKKAEKIDQYRDILNPIFPKIRDMKIQIPRYGLTLTPWLNWNENKTPMWWNAYNGVKHSRDKDFPNANLQNALNSIAGLFCLVLYYYKDEAETGKLRPQPNLFSVSSEFKNGYDVDEFGFQTIYKL